MDLIGLLFSTIAFRWYVFIFLLIYIVSASFKIGPKKTLLFTLCAWFIAYIAEFSSIRNGVPFGLYHYIPATTDREIWIWGVPFMDSLSFTFLAYASWGMARLFLSEAVSTGPFFQLREKPGHIADPSRFSWDIVVLGAVFFMLIDVVVDPVALRGDRWFLGSIYYYPEPGAYFGVTISNFVGWFVVGLLILSAWRLIDRRVGSLFFISNFPTLDLWGPALYYIVLVFNLYVTFSIGEYALGWAGVFIFTPVTALLALKVAGRC